LSLKNYILNKKTESAQADAYAPISVGYFVTKVCNG